MSDSEEIVLTFSVLNCQPEQFVSDSAEILVFTQSNALQRIVQLSDAFRQVCSAEQGQIYSLGFSSVLSQKHKWEELGYTPLSSLKITLIHS
jgi:hypothetical protein